MFHTEQAGADVFKRCDFLMGDDRSIVIVIPARLPEADTYTVSVSSRNIKFKAGYDDIATFDYQGGEVFKRIACHTQIGLVEYQEGNALPDHITNVAYVEVRRSV